MVAIILSLLQAILAIVIISAAFEGHIYFFGDINLIILLNLFLSFLETVINAILLIFLARKLEMI